INDETRPLPEDSKEDDIEITGCAVYMDSFLSGIHEFYQSWKTVIWTMMYIKLIVAYFAYFGYAMHYEFGEEGSIRLLVVTILATIFGMYQLIMKHCTIPVLCSCEGEKMDKVGIWTHRIIVIALSLFICIYVIVAIAIKTPRNLISAAGILFYVLVFYIFSKYPARVLPVIIFFSSIMSVLYYLGVMQLIIRNLARFMSWIMQTSPAESLNAAGNIFIGQRNFIEAASNGASMSIKLVANIAVNLIAFIAILGFVNATLAWVGHRVGLFNPELSFELICSYIFWPLSFLMGVDTDDCRKVAKLIGIKTFINEFVAYSVLGEYIDNTVNFTRYKNNETGTLTTGRWSEINDDILLHDLNATLVGGIITDRSKVIATYALCGFSNISSIGIMLGALGTLAPKRKSDLAKIVVRAMIAGNVACFMTACIAG
ncbi:hypothetical protein ACJMK2_023481, partial [Sinanodonta woodiana]